MALERCNIEGLDYKEYDSHLYFEIDLYDLIENKVSESIEILEHEGLNIFCNEVSIDRLDSNNTSPGYSKVDKLVIPEHIKYLALALDLGHYNNMIITDKLEYVEMHLSIYDIDMNMIIFNNFIKQISEYSGIKSLCLILDYELEKFKRKVANLPQIDTYDSLEAESQVINKINELLPRTLEYLRVNFIIKNINEFTSLKVFKIDDDCSYNVPLDNLPASLEWLEINAIDFNYPLYNLPCNLKVLIFSSDRILNYSDGYMHSLNYLPLSLEVLFMPDTIMMDGTTKAEICNNLPPKVKYLYVPTMVVNNLDWNALPESLEVLDAPLILYQMQQKEITINKLPKALKEVRIRKAYLDNKTLSSYLEIFKETNCKITGSDNFG